MPEESINKQACNVIDGLREKETHSIPHTKKWWEKSSFCTHCDDGDEDAWNLQQEQQQQQQQQQHFLSLSFSFTHLFPLALSLLFPHHHGRFSTLPHPSHTSCNYPWMVEKQQTSYGEEVRLLVCAETRR